MNQNRWMGTQFVATYTLTVTKDGSGSVSSSPAGISCGATCKAVAYKRHGNCMNTSARRCTGDTDGCGKRVRDTTCTATGRPGLADRPLETCLYEHRDRSILGCSHQQRTCRANITHVGCVFSPGWTPPGPIGYEDDGEWSEPAHGYILPTFECGVKANTCDVAFEDETVTTDAYGVVDKDDTETGRRWECHSDNGTVRQCSLPKSGG